MSTGEGVTEPIDSGNGICEPVRGAPSPVYDPVETIAIGMSNIADACNKIQAKLAYLKKQELVFIKIVRLLESDQGKALLSNLPGFAYDIEELLKEAKYNACSIR